MKKIMMFLFIYSMSVYCITFTKNFGGYGFESGKDVKIAHDGGYITLCKTSSFGEGLSNIWIYKTDIYGDEDWTALLGGNESEGPGGINYTSDGGYIVTGYTESFAVDNRDMWLVKLNEVGDVEWSMNYDNGRGEFGTAVQQLSDNGYIILGGTEVDYQDRIYVVRTDSTGTAIWDKVYGGSGYQDGVSIVSLPDDEFLIGGNYYGTSKRDYNIWLIRIDDDGNILQDQVLETGYPDRLTHLAKTNDGGFIISGYRVKNIAEELSYVSLLIKLNSDSSVEWEKEYVLNGSKLYSVVETDDSCYAATGASSVSYYAPIPYPDLLLLKTDTNGELLWYKSYNDSISAGGYSIFNTDDYGFIISGYINLGDEKYTDAWLLKTDEYGDTSINNDEFLITNYELQQNYPNPFNPETMISYSLVSNSKVSLKVFNIAGREVCNLVDQKQSKGLHKASFNGSDLTSGMYFYRLSVDGKVVASRKMMLLK